MENQQVEKQVTLKKNNSTIKILIALILLLLGFCGYLIWQNMQLQEAIVNNNVEINNVSSERDEVQNELEEMLAQYKELEGGYEELSDELKAEKEKIEALLKQVKGKNWTIHKLRKETATLRTIMKGYIVQIDSLNQANGILKDENISVKKALSSEKTKTTDLTSKNEALTNKVTIASHLKTRGLRSYGVKIKKNNTGKESEKAKKIGKIRTVFSVEKNDITPPGEKVVYIRILTPDGRVLSEKTDDTNKFDFNGVRGLYSSKQIINYQNQQMNLKIDWVKNAEFSVGEYTVEVYADGVDIGKTKFTLK